jgi:copper chaperone
MEEPKMEETVLSIPNISCGHCVMAVKNELSELNGVVSVEGDVAAKKVTVKWHAPTTLEQIRKTLVEINYPAD